MGRQVLVRTLEGRTVVVRWPFGCSALEFVKRVQEEVEHIRVSEQAIDVRLANGRRVSDGCIPRSGGTLYVTLPLNGGKGGFGKAIRDLGRGFKKLDNVDDCRDAQGRRIKRQREAEALEKYKKEAPDRELKAMGEKFVKKAAREALERAKEESVDERGERLKLKKEKRDIEKRVETAVAIAAAKLTEDQMRVSKPPVKVKKFLGESDEESDDEAK